MSCHRSRCLVSAVWCRRRPTGFRDPTVASHAVRAPADDVGGAGAPVSVQRVRADVAAGDDRGGRTTGETFPWRGAVGEDGPVTPSTRHAGPCTRRRVPHRPPTHQTGSPLQNPRACRGQTGLGHLPEAPQVFCRSSAAYGTRPKVRGRPKIPTGVLWASTCVIRMRKIVDYVSCSEL